MRSRSFTLIEVPRKKVRKKKYIYLYGKIVNILWIWTVDDWVMVSDFLTTLQRVEDKSLLVCFKTPPRRRINDKNIYMVTRFQRSQIWAPLRSDKEASFIWSIWHKAVASMNGGQTWHWLPSRNNSFIVSPTLVSRSSTSFGIASKLEEREDGPPISCMNFVELERATSIVSIRIKLYWEKGSLRSMVLRSKFDT